MNNNETNNTYDFVRGFKERYPFTIAWRLKKNASIINKHLNPGETVSYAFAAQKNNKWYNIFSTAIVTVTNKRLLIGRKRVIVGYFLDSITPDLFNDLKVKSGVVWGKISIDTVKELVFLSNLSKSALPEIETQITSFMIEEKKKYNIDSK